MKKFLFLIHLTFIVSFLALAKQYPEAKFGKIEQKDVELTFYEKDPSADALVLHDEGISTFVYSQSTGFDIHFERLTRIKILKKQGYHWANFEIPLYGSTGKREAIQRISGYTYNIVDGKVERVKLEKTSIFYEELNESWTVAKVAFPSVVEGSVVELQYTLVSPYTSQLRSWGFQDRIPVAWSEYTVKIPEYFNYLKFTQGYEPFEFIDEKSENHTISINYNQRSANGYTVQSQPKVETVNLINYVTRFAARDLPAFKDEDFIARPDDYFLKVEYQLASVKWPNEPLEDVLGNWAQVEARLLEHPNFGGYIKRRAPFKELSEQIAAQVTTEKDKAIMAAAYLTKTVTWNGKSRMLASDNVKLLEDKSGSSADINLFYVGLLQELGLSAYPVIISTRNNGKVHPVHPLLDKYNYVITQVEIDGKPVLVDLTDPYVPFGLLPEKCLNELGRRIDKVNPGWVTIEVPLQSTQTYSVEMTLTEERSIEASVKRKAEGYFAIEAKKSVDSKGEDEYRKSMAAPIENWEVSDVILNPGEGMLFNEEFKIMMVSSDASTNLLYLDTMPFLKISENPFKQDERMYPIDFRFPTKNVMMSKIVLPAGYKIEELPIQKSFALPSRGGLFTFSVTSAGNVINVYSRFDINKSVYLPDQYEFIKAAYDEIIAAHAQQIVLKKL